MCVIGLNFLNFLKDSLWSLMLSGMIGSSDVLDLVTLLLWSFFFKCLCNANVILFSKDMTSSVSSSIFRDLVLGMKDSPLDSIDISCCVRVYVDKFNMLSVLLGVAITCLSLYFLL